MISSENIQGKISKGMGLAAGKYGYVYTVYRPKTVSLPIQDRNRIFKIPAVIQPEGVSGGRIASVWRGTFDSFYTRPGDYLIGENGTFFIGAQLPSTPIYCVFTNRTVSVARPSFADQGGYSGLYASNNDLIIEKWPASLSESGNEAGALKAEGSMHSNWTILLPPLPVDLRTADVVTDDSGSSYVVSAAEAGGLGWRVIAKRTTT